MDTTTLTFVAVALVCAVVLAWVASARAREEEYRRRVRWCIRRGME